MNTFPKKCILIGLLTLAFSAKAQVNNIDNLGFEKGTFEGWTLSYGQVQLGTNGVKYINEKPGTISNRHEIVSVNQGNDPKIKNEAVPMVYTGGRYSMRIGKTQNGNTFEKASTNFTVTADHSLFQYHFAVLLQEDADNHHTKFQKPGFSLKITDLGGTQITCGDFDVQLEGNLLTGFKAQGDIEYRNWTTGAIDLRSHIGKTLKVEIIAHGCTGQGHFGYAYFDAELIKSEIKQISVCPDLNGNMTLIAPDGFEKYVWSNNVTGKAITAKPVLGEPFKVTITPYSSLDAACNFSLYYNIPFKRTDTTLSVKLCDGEQFKVEDTFYKTTGNFSKIISRGGICDSTVNLKLIVDEVPKINMIFNKCDGENIKIRDSIITTGGNYKIIIPRSGKCDSIVFADVLFEKLEIKSPENQTITIGDQINLIGNTIEGTTGNNNWIEEKTEICNQCSSVTVSPITDKTYYYKVASQSNICSRIDTTQVRVVPCKVHFPDTFSPDADGLNSKFFGKGSSCVSKITLLEIYDRWGVLIFKTENTPVSDENFGWDGKVNGLEEPSGLYIFKAKAALLDGSFQEYLGNLYLLR